MTVRIDALPDDWCYSCWQSEPLNGKRPYNICGECGHVYWTARQLRRAYRRTLAARMPDQPHRRRWFGYDPFDLTWAQLAWYSITARASRIYHCQECAHDF